jgi:PAS domain S-box-containing protein
MRLESATNGIGVIHRATAAAIAISVPRKSAVFCAALSTLIGLITLAISPASAAVLILMGLALFAMATNRPRFALIGSAITGLAIASLLAAAELGIYGLDAANPILPPAAALSFLALAGGFLLAGTRPPAQRSPILGLSSLLAACVAGYCGIGEIWGASDLWGLSYWMRMPLSTSLGLAILAAGAMMIALEDSQTEPRLPAWAATGTGIFVAVIRMGLLQAFSPKHSSPFSSTVAIAGALFGAAVFAVFTYLALKTRIQREQLRFAQEKTERRVEERTSALEAANRELRAEIALREQAEEDLRRQKELLESIVDHVPILLKFADREGRVQMVNREWERVLGQTKEDDPAERERLLEFNRAPDGQWTDFRTNLQDGRVIDTTWAAVRLSDGATIYIGQNISQRKQAERELRKQKEILQTIFDHIPVMINFADENLKFQLVNREWERTLGWSLEEMVRDDVDILAENYPDPVYRSQVRHFVLHSKGEWADFKTRVRDGRVIDTSWIMLHLPGGTNIGIGQDITRRKRAEAALRESEERFRQLTENIHEVFWLTTPDFAQTLYLSPTYRTLTGEPPESLCAKGGKRFLDVVHPDDRTIVEELHKNPGREFDVEFRVIHAGGSVRWIRDRGFPIRDSNGTLSRMGGVAEDITDRKESEILLKTRSEQLRALSASLQSAREEEATRIAHQIHDDMGGILTALRWDLESVAKMIDQPGDLAPLKPEMQTKLATMLGLTDTTINVVRRIASELRPSILDDLGLMEAVEWQAQQFQSRTGIECRCHCAVPSLALDQDQSTAVFRIFQEALTNILRHAQATRVDVIMNETEDDFVLTVADNGRGITQDEKASRTSLGILSMQERARLVEGDVDIVGRPTGTTVRVRVQLAGPVLTPGAGQAVGEGSD